MSGKVIQLRATEQAPDRVAGVFEMLVISRPGGQFGTNYAVRRWLVGTDGALPCEDPWVFHTLEECRTWCAKWLKGEGRPHQPTPGDHPSIVESWV